MTAPRKRNIAEYSEKKKPHNVSEIWLRVQGAHGIIHGILIKWMRDRLKKSIPIKVPRDNFIRRFQGLNRGRHWNRRRN